MPTYVEVAVNVLQITGEFDYHLPEELVGHAGIGHLVLVPFGKNTVQGVILRFLDVARVAETRPVIDLLDPVPVLTSAQISLARYLKREYLAPLAACIDIMLPPGLSQRIDKLYSLSFISSEDSKHLASKLSNTQNRLLNLLQRRGALRGQQIDRSMGKLDWRSSVSGLVKQGLVTTQTILPPPNVKPKFVRTAQLACPPEIALQTMTTQARKGSQAQVRRKAILSYLAQETGPVNVTWVYAESGGNLQDLYFLAENGLVVLGESEVWRDPLERMEYQPSRALDLTRDQTEVWKQIETQLQASLSGLPFRPVLLHGVTGSGKTEIYLSAVEETLKQGRQAIVMVPEIALTPQAVRRFANRFPGQVGLIHSGLTHGERYDTWRRARQGNLSVIVGPRSALFVPFTRLGLIVVDECHDDSYYQSEKQPFYHARQAAIAYAGFSGAVCLLGSATPDVTTTYAAEQGKFLYLRLPDRIMAHRQVVQMQAERNRLESIKYQPFEGMAESLELPPVEIVDMRLELQSGNRSMFSHALSSGLEQILKANQQAILFLNRRGSATYVFCRNCGYVLQCPRCEIPLTYHMITGQQTSNLLCHRCGYRRGLPNTCPSCKSRHIRHYGAGTERVEAEVKVLFPQARTLRWDYDTTRQRGAHEIILSHFSNHHADILIGTQMIAKGLDMPLVTLVGVVLADVGLNLPDYRAAERTFQILTQVSGRAGRSPLGGRVILQTFQPEHYAIQAASRHNYGQFYLEEIANRRRLGFPPFKQLVRLEYRHNDPAQAEQAAKHLARDLASWITQEDRRDTQLIGPAPCFFQREAGSFRWQIIIRGPNPTQLLQNRVLDDWKIEVNPPNLL